MVTSGPNHNSTVAEGWLFPRFWAASLLTLIAATWPLWFPILAAADYPAIALPAAAGRVPPSGLSAVSLLLVCALLRVTVARADARRWWWLVAATLVIGFAIDQHRLQPWAYQGALYAVAFAGLDPARARRWLIVLAASVYIYSAVGKLDYQFAYTVGQDLLAVVCRPIGGLPAAWEPSRRALAALGFPLLELLGGIGLLIPRTRATAAVVIIAMHAGLIMILSPWGLDHSDGVLVWNAALIAQAWLLFWRRPTWRRRPASAAGPIQVILLAGLLAPLGERSGYWDHWPSWALYAPHTSRVEIEIQAAATDRLPPSLNRRLAPDSDGDRWHRLDLAGWSLQQRRVPIYPQARYQLELARWISRQFDLGDQVRVRWRGTADRWTGQRTDRWLLGEDELHRGG